MPHLTYNRKESILDDISNKMSYRSIGDKYGISQTTVSRFLKRFCQGEQKSFLSQSGRQKKLQSNEILRMKQIASKNPFLWSKVWDEAMLSREISIQTASRYLRNFGILDRVAKRVNYHCAKHMSKRRQFCISVKQWDFLRCQKVIFTDEVRIEMESRRRFFLRRPVGARNKARYWIEWKYSEKDH